jgi:hypothetical protein
VTEYSFLTPISQLEDITAGPDGNLWFVENNGNKIGKITTSGTITEYALPSGRWPEGITAGPDGNLWFTELADNIGKITTSGTITEYAIPTGASSPYGIAAGPDGNLWFTEGIGKIGKVSGIGCSNGPFKIGSTIYSEYPTVQAMYEAMGDATLLMQAQTFGGDLTLDQNKTIELQGGYDCGFTSNAGESILSDKLTIQHGEVTVDKIIIK